MGRKERLSNMELLRLVAMFMVMAVHANFYALGIPSTADVAGQPLQALTRAAIEGFSCVCVDVFVLLSGWFGIRLKWRGFFGLVFQCLFFSFTLYALAFTLGWNERTPIDALRESLKFGDYWFVRCYIVLYVIAPALNLFVSRVPRLWQVAIITAFFAFEVAADIAPGFCKLFDNGYTVWSFAGLYVLARHLRAFPYKFTALPAAFHFALYLLLVAANVAAAFLYAQHKSQPVSAILCYYTNPLVIGAALALILGFSHLTIKSAAVNTLAASAFAIYLFHKHPFVCGEYYLPIVKTLYANNSGIPCLALITLFLLCVAIAAIAADRVRIFLWGKICKAWDNAYEHTS